MNNNGYQIISNLLSEKKVTFLKKLATRINKPEVLKRAKKMDQKRTLKTIGKGAAAIGTGLATGLAFHKAMDTTSRRKNENEH
jgi:hypothetical protein